MVETDMRCNVLGCRKLLSFEIEACVTSCSHIFCFECSSRLFAETLVCPACNTSLPENGDIILSQLNPSEQYKSSVLAGLKPEVVLDISSRAIAFYEYQVSQEMSLNKVLKTNLEEKYGLLREQFSSIHRELKHTIKVEKEKQSNLLKERELDRNKNLQLSSLLEEKNKQFQKLQSMYEKLKRKAITPNIKDQQELLKPTFATPKVIVPGSKRTTASVSSVHGSLSKLGQAPGPRQFLSLDRDAFEKPLDGMSRIPSPIKTVYSVRSARYPASKKETLRVSGSVAESNSKKSTYHRKHHHHNRPKRA